MKQSPTRHSPILHIAISLTGLKNVHPTVPGAHRKFPGKKFVNAREKASFMRGGPVVQTSLKIAPSTCKNTDGWQGKSEARCSSAFRCKKELVLRFLQVNECSTDRRNLRSTVADSSESALFSETSFS